MRLTIVALGPVALLAGCIPSLDEGYENAPPPPPPAVQRGQQPPDFDDWQDRTYPPTRDEPPPREDRAYQPPPQEGDDPVSTGDRKVVSLPAPRPAWEARSVVADAQDIASTSYVVAPGDTLGRIAARTGAGADAIARANGIPPPYNVRVGERLRIPGGRYHLVHPGESGIAIARAYGVPWSRIVAVNELTEPFILRTGQRVLIPNDDPDRDRPAPSSAAQRAAAFRLDIDDILTGGEPALAANASPARAVPGPTRVLPPTAALLPPARFAGNGFAWPVDGRVIARFGVGQSGEKQNGINIAAPLGTPVRAAADGIVAYVGSGIQSLGGLVILKHGSNWVTVYGYNARLLVQRGQSVKRGQTIALSGATGSIDRPAVHFELRRGRTPVNPEDQLTRSRPSS